jgi:hypothetical protein
MEISIYREQIRGIPIERPILSISEGIGYAHRKLLCIRWR